MININNIYKERFINKSVKERYGYFNLFKFPFYKLYSLDKINFHKSFILITDINEDISIAGFYIELYNQHGKFQKDFYYN